MNRSRAALICRRMSELYQELAEAIEEEERPRQRKPKLEVVPPPVDELVMKKADQILKRKGLLR